jgi:glyoxylase-like metal-dependent hydrolase (beta-lactamase superfamily II)
MAPDDRNRVPLAFNCYLIETGSATVLIETGGGHIFDDRSRDRMKLPQRVAPLPEILAAEGVDVDRIDLVINTHLHWDHCSGNMLDGAPAFPRATYVTQRGEWQYAHERNARDSISYLDRNYDPLVESGRMRLLDGDTELLPGISVEVAPGHNRDMMVVKAQSRGETFCLLADLVPTAEHLKPTWVAAFDLFPLLTMETRRKLYAPAAREGWYLGFGHDMRNAFARIDSDFQIIETIV